MEDYLSYNHLREFCRSHHYSFDALKALEAEKKLEITPKALEADSSEPLYDRNDLAAILREINAPKKIIDDILN